MRRDYEASAPTLLPPPTLPMTTLPSPQQSVFSENLDGVRVMISLLGALIMIMSIVITALILQEAGEFNLDAAEKLQLWIQGLTPFGIGAVVLAIGIRRR